MSDDDDENKFTDRSSDQHGNDASDRSEIRDGDWHALGGDDLARQLGDRFRNSANQDIFEKATNGNDSFPDQDFRTYMDRREREQPYGLRLDKSDSLFDALDDALHGRFDSIGERGLDQISDWSEALAAIADTPEEAHAKAAADGFSGLFDLIAGALGYPLESVAQRDERLLNESHAREEFTQHWLDHHHGSWDPRSDDPYSSLKITYP